MTLPSHSTQPLFLQACNRHVILFLFTWFTLGTLQAQDQDWKIKHISVEDGLLNRFVNCVTEDNRGFIWVGTNFGLYRYDGYHVEVMTAEQNGLSSNTIYGVFLDQNNNLWVVQHDTRPSAISHIDVVNPITFEVLSLSNYLPAGTLEGLNIQEIFTGNNREIYFQSDQNDLYRYDSIGVKKILHMNFRSYQHDPGLAYVDDAFFFQNGTSDTLLQWTKEGQFVTAIACPSLGQTRDQKVIWNYICKASDGGRLFEGYIKDRVNYSLFELYPNGIFQKKIEYEVRNLPAVYRDPYRDILWIQTKDDFFNFDPVTGEKLGQSIFQPLTSFSLLVGRDGQIWKGTQNGLYNFKAKPTYFTAVNMPDFDNQSSRGITGDAFNTIYVLTYGGCYKFYPKSGKTEIWNFPSQIVGIAATTDHAGNIWCTEEVGNCYKYNPRTNTFEVSYPDHPGFISTWDIMELSTGDLGVGTTEGLWLKHPNDTLPIFPFKGSTADEGLSRSTVMHMAENKEGLWLATSIGLFLVDLQSGVKSVYNKDNSDLPFNELLFVHIDSNGTFWLGSRGGGLIKWDREKNTFQSFSTSNGLSNNVIYAVYEDDFGFLWLTSDFGLMRFEKETGICRTFLPEDGIPHEEFNRASHFKDKEGNFYFGGLNGMVTFNPKNIRESDKTNFPFLITKFEVYDEASGQFQDWTNRVLHNEQVLLQPRMKSFTVQYAILDYDDPRLKRYAYKIEGLTDNWNYVSENFVRINGLSGGNYTLHVKGQNTRGEWTENELIIPIRVLQPFLLRPLTMAIMILAFAGLVIFLARRRIELHKQKLEREKNISQQLRHVDKLKDQFLANTSHELRTPLNGIVGLSESLLEDAPQGRMQEDLELIISSGRRLSNLVNDILDFSRLKKHDLQLSRRAVNVHGMAELLIRLNKPLLQGKEVTLVNLIPKSLPYCLADENRLQQILQNLIANAIKFTHEGSISLSAHTEGIMNVIAVTDTGIGIEESKQDMIFNAFEQADGTISREYGGSGLGLSITKHLVKLHGGKIRLQSAPGIGSTFSFTIPVYDGIVEIEAMEQNLLLEDAKDALKMPITSNGNNSHPVGHVPASNSHHILIVDDEPVNLRVLKNHLEKEGYRVTMAQNGYDALQLLEDDPSFHLVLLDVMMPRIPGYEVCQKIRERYMLTELPVIMVTSKNQVNDLVEGLAYGANDYIHKPFSKDELLARVKTQLQTFEIQEATGRFVPHEFIHSLGRHGITDLVLGDMVERKVHVMFSDIRDYTTLAEDMTPLENFKFVNSLAGKVGPVVKRNHGIINQYLGDTIMTLFLEKADDGVTAGIQILQLIEQYNLQREKENRKPVRLGIGLHTGPLMMGIIGDTHRTEAAVISDTVNTASRMEGLTKHFAVNFIISEDTVNKLEGPALFNLRYLGRVQAKGKYNPIGIFECIDGDNEKQRALKLNTLDQFKKAMDAYHNKDFNTALSCFETVYKENPGDRTTFGFIHKVHMLLENGMPKDWNGVEMMSFK